MRLPLPRAFRSNLSTDLQLAGASSVAPAQLKRPPSPSPLRSSELHLDSQPRPALLRSDMDPHPGNGFELRNALAPRKRVYTSQVKRCPQSKHGANSTGRVLELNRKGRAAFNMDTSLPIENPAILESSHRVGAMREKQVAAADFNGLRRSDRPARSRAFESQKHHVHSPLGGRCGISDSS